MSFKFDMKYCLQKVSTICNGPAHALVCRPIALTMQLLWISHFTASIDIFASLGTITNGGTSKN